MTNDYLRDSQFVPDGDGYQMVLGSTSPRVDKDRFDRELTAALEFASTTRCNVQWTHNGCLAQTDDEISPGGAWSVFTERNAEQGN